MIGRKLARKAGITVALCVTMAGLTLSSGGAAYADSAQGFDIYSSVPGGHAWGNIVWEGDWIYLTNAGVKDNQADGDGVVLEIPAGSTVNDIYAAGNGNITRVNSEIIGKYSYTYVRARVCLTSDKGSGSFFDCGLYMYFYK